MIGQAAGDVCSIVDMCPGSQSSPCCGHNDQSSKKGRHFHGETMQMIACWSMKELLRGAVHYWTAPGPTIMQHAVMDSATIFSEKQHDSRQNLRWLAWERKNRRGDRIAERRMKVVFAAVGVILLMVLIAYALSDVSEPRGRVEKGPTVAFLGTIGPLRYCVESGKGLKPV